MLRPQQRHLPSSEEGDRVLRVHRCAVPHLLARIRRQRSFQVHSLRETFLRRFLLQGSVPVGREPRRLPARLQAFHDGQQALHLQVPGRSAGLCRPNDRPDQLHLCLNAVMNTTG